MSLRLFVDLPLAPERELDLPASAARHAQVRRLQPADRLVLFDGRGGEWQAGVVDMRRDRVTVRVGAFDPVSREPRRRVVVALGMPANERMDFLVEKATELGAAAIQPLLCERSVLRPAGDRAARKREHWQAIAAAAAEQSGRTRVPVVAPVSLLGPWLDGLGETGALRLLLSPEAGAVPLAHLVEGLRLPGRPEGATGRRAQPEGAPPSALVTLSGPEGGLAPDEQAAAIARGFVAARLGGCVLRAETAPLAVLAWALLADGDNSGAAASSAPPAEPSPKGARA